MVPLLGFAHFGLITTLFAIKHISNRLYQLHLTLIATSESDPGLSLMSVPACRDAPYNETNL
jgi:hypothetical protein